MKNQKGFSLIELLIVVVVIGIIAAIAIPNLLAARRASNEGSAVSSLRTYHGAQMTYQSSIGSGNYAGDSSALTPTSFSELYAHKFIDEVLGSGTKSGYHFIGAQVPASNGNPPQFTGYAYPSVPSGAQQTGTQVYSIMTDGVVFQGTYGSIVTTTNGGTLITSTGGSPINN